MEMRPRFSICAAHWRTDLITSYLYPANWPASCLISVKSRCELAGSDKMSEDFGADRGGVSPDAVRRMSAD